MPTSLVTSRMSPELAQRIRVSVSGRQSGGSPWLRARLVSVLRLGGALALAGLVTFAVGARQRSVERLSRQRAELLSRWKHETREIKPEQLALVQRLQRLVAAATGAYPGDVIADELRGEAAFSAALAHQLVYVRGSLVQLASQGGFREGVAESHPDASVACLIDPPTTATERALLSKARGALGRSARTGALARVERLYPALATLPFFAPEWQHRVTVAEGQDLVGLDDQLRRAPFAAARRALASSRLLLVVDEPADTPGPTELDGERAHPVRVALIDLTGDRTLLRLRLRVDPSWISPAARAEHARGLTPARSLSTCGLERALNRPVAIEMPTRRRARVKGAAGELFCAS